MEKNNTSSDKAEIDHIVELFFKIFTNTTNSLPDFTIIHKICIPDTIIIKKEGATEQVYNLQSFIAPRKKILSDGTLVDFEEKEINEETKIIGNIAQRFSKYQKSGYLKGAYFKDFGTKFFQFIKTSEGWKINALIWEDEKIQ